MAQPSLLTIVLIFCACLISNGPNNHQLTRRQVVVGSPTTTVAAPTTVPAPAPTTTTVVTTAPVVPVPVTTTTAVTTTSAVQTTTSTVVRGATTSLTTLLAQTTSTNLPSGVNQNVSTTGDSGISTTAIIAIATAAGCVFLIILGIFLFRRKGKKHHTTLGPVPIRAQTVSKRSTEYATYDPPTYMTQTKSLPNVPSQEHISIGDSISAPYERHSMSNAGIAPPSEYYHPSMPQQNYYAPQYSEYYMQYPQYAGQYGAYGYSQQDVRDQGYVSSGMTQSPNINQNESM